MRIRSRIFRSPFYRTGICAVCGKEGRYSNYDTSLEQLLCEPCLPDMLSAEALLVANQLEHPCIALVRLNP